MSSMSRKQVLKSAYEKASKRFPPGAVQLERDQYVTVTPSSDAPVIVVSACVDGTSALYRVGTLVAWDVDWEAAPGALLFVLCENASLGHAKFQISGGQLQLERFMEVETTKAKQLANAIWFIGTRAKRLARDLQLLGGLAKEAD